MSKHGAERTVSDDKHSALVALAWHDVVCPDGPECKDRPDHAAVQGPVRSGHLERFLRRLPELEREADLSAL